MNERHPSVDVLAALEAGPNDIDGNKSFTCRLCDEPMIIHDGMEPTAICDTCAHESLDVLAEALDMERTKFEVAITALGDVTRKFLGVDEDAREYEVVRRAQTVILLAKNKWFHEGAQIR